MARISDVTLPGGTKYDIGQSTGAEYIRGTWTAATNAWTGVTTDSELYDNKEIILYLPFAGTSTATTLNLTLSGGGTTGAKAVYFNSTTRHTNHYGQYQMVRMVYHKSHNVAGTDYEGWWMDYARDTNDTAYLTYQYYSGFTAATALYTYQICIRNGENSLLPMNTTSNSTATTKTLTTESFYPFGPILYYNNTSTVSKGATIPNDRLYDGANLVNIGYSFNTGSTLAANKAVWIVCSPQSDGKAKLHSAPISQTTPTSDDGLYYIYLGQAYNTTSVALSRTHPVFMYKNGAFREISQYAPYAGDAATVSGHTVAIDVPSSAKFTDTTYSSKSAASGGTEVSLVTTGEKYTWNNKASLAIGTTATTAAAGNHTHTTTIATSTGTSQISLAANTKYAITAGGTSYVFTTPPDTNTTYSSKAAASGGTDASLVTTGEKYTWNSKTNTAVKGNAESSYRTGNVNITPANIGLGNIDNTFDPDTETLTLGYM